MRDLESIQADARDSSPFSNGTSGEIWMGRWCYRCKVDAAFQAGTADQGCPLLIVAYTGQTPAEWTEVGLQDYHCSEFVPDDEGDGGGDGAPLPPAPPMDGQVDLFEVFADQIATEVATTQLAGVR